MGASLGATQPVLLGHVVILQEGKIQLSCRHRKEVKTRLKKYSQFSLFVMVMFYKVAMNTELGL